MNQTKLWYWNVLANSKEEESDEDNNEYDNAKEDSDKD